MAQPTTLDNLDVAKADRNETYQDLIRIPEAHRSGLEEGRVYLIQNPVTQQKRHVILRGKQGHAERSVWMDERTRKALGISTSPVTLTASRCGFIGELVWAYDAADPSYRIPARIAVLSMIAGVAGVALGAGSIVLTLLLAQ